MRPNNALITSGIKYIPLDHSASATLISVEPISASVYTVQSTIELPDNYNFDNVNFWLDISGMTENNVALFRTIGASTCLRVSLISGEGVKVNALQTSGSPPQQGGSVAAGPGFVVIGNEIRYSFSTLTGV